MSWGEILIKLARNVSLNAWTWGPYFCGMQGDPARTVQELVNKVMLMIACCRSAVRLAQGNFQGALEDAREAERIAPKWAQVLA